MHEKNRFIVGIDLGTTNSAVAYVDTDLSKNPHLTVQLFRIPQLNEAGVIEALPMLPSFYYMAGAGEFPKGSLLLPWKKEEPDYAVGVFAREQGSKVPTHLIHSAKSWLSNAAANRRDKLLPFEASENERKMSPVEASASFLSHLRDAWNAVIAKNDPSLCLEEQEVILTVPASFDEVARSLTVEAARLAGLQHLTLLEEPQAAFYHWLMEHENEKSWLKEGDTIVVCDIGGGTTDFSLLRAIQGKEGIGFQRTAVGKHLLLGGDNMDMAICNLLEASLATEELEMGQWLFLRHQARMAKERLLSQAVGAHYTFWIPGKGSQIVGGGKAADITFEQVESLLVEGFFGLYDREEALQLQKGSGVRVMGLPYETEPSITKHLAFFLDKSGQKEKPAALLFNGGALKPLLFQKRLIASLDKWFPGQESIRLLTASQLDLAVAKGAAYFGKARRGFGVRVGGGTARSYYLSVDVKSPSGEIQKQAMTLVRRGAEEGLHYTPDHLFSLLPNRPVSFQLFHSHTRLGDVPGSLIPVEDEGLSPLASVQTVLRYGKQKEITVPVKLEVSLTEIGTLELWLVSTTSDHRWKLEFQLRGQDQSDALQNQRLSDETFEMQDLVSAKKTIEEAFSIGQKENLKQLNAVLERLVGQPRGKWPPSVLRAFFDVLIKQAPKRTFSAEYEARFWNLAGYFLRPGVGYPLDDFRMKEIWKLVLADLGKPKTEEVEIQQAICFRRLSAGLGKGQQLQIFNLLFPLVYDKKRQLLLTKGKKGGYAYSERVRALASLELADIPLKEKLAEALIQRLEKGAAEACDYWALGRIGARHLLYGSAAAAIPPSICAQWIKRLLKTPAADATHVPFLLTMLARKTDCREINLSADILQEVKVYLDRHAASDLETLLLSERALSSQEQEQFFGDSIPSGLILTL